MQEKSNKNEFQKNSKKMIFALVYPRKKHHIYMDQRTRDYLHNVETNIGLLEMIRKWDTSLLSVEYRYPLFWNPTCEGFAHVGKKGNHWIAQVSLFSDGMQHDVIRYRFEILPQPEDILIANTLNQIYTYFSSLEHSLEEMACHQCGEIFHWIEQKGTLEDKWVSFQEKYCGCE